MFDRSSDSHYANDIMPSHNMKIWFSTAGVLDLDFLCFLNGMLLIFLLVGVFDFFHYHHSLEASFHVSKGSKDDERHS